MKYRIVYRPKKGLYCFYAQKKWLNLFWIDLLGHSCSGGPGYESGAETPSHSQKLVENYIEYVAMAETGKDIVVKTYE